MKSSPTPTNDAQRVEIDEASVLAELKTFAEEARRVHVTWTLWRRLFNPRADDFSSIDSAFAAGQEAYRVTGKTSALLFVYIRWHMWRGVVLDLSRLCDKKFSAGQANLTIERVVERLEQIAPVESTRWVKHQCDVLLEFARDPQGLQYLRNKAIAHFALESAMRPDDRSGPDDDAIDTAVRRLVSFVDFAERASRREQPDPGDPQFEVDRSIEDQWNTEAERLLATLARGLEPSGESAPSS